MLEDFQKLIDSLPKPQLQAIVVYDCALTQESSVLIDSTVSLWNLCLLFGSEVQPILSWIDPYGDRALRELFPGPKRDRGPLAGGQAIVLSRATYDKILTTVKPEERDGVSTYLGTPIYFLSQETFEEVREKKEQIIRRLNSILYPEESNG
jgi:hypothetical protein